jgi:hypothetical protein
VALGLGEKGEQASDFVVEQFEPDAAQFKPAPLARQAHPFSSSRAHVQLRPEGDAVGRRQNERSRPEARDVIVLHPAVLAADFDQADLQPTCGLTETRFGSRLPRFFQSRRQKAAPEAAPLIRSLIVKRSANPTFARPLPA